ncbi:glycosyltransferase [Priestia flexa]|uniref:glycosyltransferase n=1 Tax=Priestia flexa TaxID=86664 RepID=UPI0032EE8605
MNSESMRTGSIGASYMKPRIVAFIPAHNEEKSIRDCLEGLGDQLLPNRVDLDMGYSYWSSFYFKCYFSSENPNASTH